MFVIVTELDAGCDVPKHSSTQEKVPRHQYLFDDEIVFWSENYTSPQKEKSYDHRQKEKNSFYNLK